MGYKVKWTSEEMKEMVNNLSPEELKSDFEEYGFQVEVAQKDSKKTSPESVLTKVSGVLMDETKVATCEFCKKENVVVHASGYHVAFVCEECL